VTPDTIGSLLGAVGGLAFIQAGAGALPADVEIAARGAGLLAFLLVLRALHQRQGAASGAGRSPRALSRGYGIVVGAEVLGIVVGLRLLNGPVDTPQAAPAWIAFVVGTHFVALALLLRQPGLTWLGHGVTACGAAGLTAAFLGGSDPLLAVVAGLAPGALLLAAAGRAAVRSRVAALS
jgi:hypothetical protein